MFEEKDLKKVEYDSESDYFFKQIGKQRELGDGDSFAAFSNTFTASGELALYREVHGPARLLNFLSDSVISTPVFGVAAGILMDMDSVEIAHAEIGELCVMDMADDTYHNLREVLMSSKDSTIKQVLHGDALDTGRYCVCCHIKNGFLVYPGLLTNRIVVAGPEVWIMLKSIIKFAIENDIPLDELMDAPIANFPNNDFICQEEFLQRMRKILIAFGCEDIGISLGVFED